MNFAINMMFKFSSLFGANGVGPSNSTNSEVSGSWLTEVLAWIADFVVKLATVVWGWLISIFYVVVKWCLNLIDILQMFVEKLVGIDVFNQEGGLGAVQKLEDTDVIIRFITNETIIDVFTTIMILGAILLVIFCILALVKQNYAAATTEGSDGVKNPTNVLKTAGKAIFLCLLIPILLIVGILGSNAVLASICNSIKGDNDLTIGGLIFTASAYEANKYREYASDGLRVPITHVQGTEVVRPNDYTTYEDMQVLFYKLVKGDIYISHFSDNSIFQANYSSYSNWRDKLSVEDVSVDVGFFAGSPVFNQFREDFNDFMTADTFGLEGQTLSELGAFNPIINSIYDSNWSRNKSLLNITYDFSSTYTVSDTVNFNYTVYDVNAPGSATASTGNGGGVQANIYMNSNTYSQYENFTPIELEYYVMADLIDYAVEHNQVFYYVNANNSAIKWSNIDLDPESEDDEIINIEEYNAQFLIYADVDGYHGEYYKDAAAKDEILKKNSGVELASSAFMVKYYNGVNRLYWSVDDAERESDGATYIICIKTEDGFIPVTQNTTSFRSNFLADDYGGAIVARGIFANENIFPKDYCLPTEITEQKVDDYGNELYNTEQISPISISDTLDVKAYQQVTVSSIMKNFCGDLKTFGVLGAGLVEGLIELGGLITSGIKDQLQGSFIEKMGETTETTGLLVNPNISGFRYDANQTHVTFYDYNGRIVSGGTKDGELLTSFEIIQDEDSDPGPDGFGKTGYVLLQKTQFGTKVIPYIFTDATTIGEYIEKVFEAEVPTNDYSFLIAKYTYDNIRFKAYDTENAEQIYRMLINFEINEIVQFNYDDSGNLVKTEKSSGEFIIIDGYDGETHNIAIEKVANLVVSDGEIYYSDGTLFFGKNDAKNLYYDFSSNYFSNNFLGGALSGNNLFQIIGTASADGKYQELMKTLGLTPTNDGEENQSNLTGSLLACDMRAGLAALVEEYDKEYFSVKSDGTAGTISYFNKVNKPTGSSVSYTSSETVEETIKLSAVVVCGPIDTPNENNVSYVTILESGTNYDSSSFGKVYAINDCTAPSIEERNKYTYDISYKIKYVKYLDDQGKIVAVSGVTLSSPTLVSPAAPAQYLTVKNNGIYCPALGEYVLTTSGMKKYLSSYVDHGTGIKIKDDSGNAINKADGTAYKNMTAENLTMRNQAEYNNMYIYFIRGDFNWTFIFDFCIHLPTISWSPFRIDFAFRFKMGTSYNYIEDVIYRLQSGMFYLDYNFRTNSGIGMGNLYRMSSINPFVLIFSTVLVMSIIWNTVWGLIRRIYDIVLLFIMLPAVCATMPIDDGGRFKKWKEEIIQKIFQAYSVLIMLNIYFVLIPMLRDVTSNLITSTDLPSTITGIFGSVGAGMNSMVGAIPTLGNKISSIAPMLLETSELTTAEMALLGHVNSIIYIMFFLVLTTMLKNGKKTIETILGIAALEDGVFKESMDNTFGQTQQLANKVKNSAVGKMVGGAVKGAAGLAIKGATKLGSKAFEGLRGGGGEGGPAEGEPTETTATEPPPIADGGGDGAPLAGDIAEPVGVTGGVPLEGEAMAIETSDGPMEGVILPPVDETGVVPVTGSDTETGIVPSSGDPTATNALPSGEDYVPSDEELKDFVSNLSNDELNDNISQIKANAELETSEGLQKGLKFMEEEQGRRASSSGESQPQSETGDGEQKAENVTSENKGANSVLSDEELTDKIINGKTLEHTIDKKFENDHKGFESEDYKAEAERVRGLRNKAMEDFDKRDESLGQIERDKKRALEEATAKRNSAEQKINDYKNQNPNKEVPKELELELSKAKLNQTNASDALSTATQNRKQNQKDKETADRRIRQYARKLENFANGTEKPHDGTTVNNQTSGQTLNAEQQQAAKGAVKNAGTVQANQGRLSDEEIQKQGWSGDTRSKEAPKTTSNTGSDSRLEKLEKEVNDLKQQIKGNKPETKATSTSSSETSTEKPKRTFKDKAKTVGKVVGLGAVTLAAPGVGGAIIAGTLAVKGGKKVVDKTKSSKLSKTAVKWNKKVNNKWDNMSKGAKIATAATAGTIGIVAAPAATIAVAGGVLAVKGGKKVIDKTKSYLSSHPKLKTAAKYTGLAMVSPPAAAVVGGYNAVKYGVKKAKESSQKKKEVKIQTKSTPTPAETSLTTEKPKKKYETPTATVENKTKKQYESPTATIESSTKKKYEKPTATVENRQEIKEPKKSSGKRVIDLMSEPEPTGAGQKMVKNAADELQKRHERNEANNPMNKSKK